MNIQEAKTGDAILINKESGLMLKNEYAVGIVRVIKRDSDGKIKSIGIEVLTETVFGHNLGGVLDNNNGWWFFDKTEKELSIIKENELNGFKIGDRVESVNGVGTNSVIGATGTVVGFNKSGNCMAVLFDKEYDIVGHDFYTTTGDKLLQADRRDGWFCERERIKNISERNPKEPEKAESKDIEHIPQIGELIDSIFDSYIEQVPKQYIYVARDMDGKLFAYIDEPIIDIGRMQYYAKRYKKINDNLFPELKYEKGILNVKTKEIIVK